MRIVQLQTHPLTSARHAAARRPDSPQIPGLSAPLRHARRIHSASPGKTPPRLVELDRDTRALAAQRAPSASPRRRAVAVSFGNHHPGPLLIARALMHSCLRTSCRFISLSRNAASTGCPTDPSDRVFKRSPAGTGPPFCTNASLRHQCACPVLTRDAHRLDVSSSLGAEPLALADGRQLSVSVRPPRDVDDGLGLPIAPAIHLVPPGRIIQGARRPG